MSEATLQREILLYLCSRLDCLAWRVNSLLAFGRNRAVRSVPKGHADIAGILSIAGLGFSFFVEVKSKSGKQSKEQRAFQLAVEKLGALYVLARSIPEVEQALMAKQVATNKMLKT